MEFSATDSSPEKNIKKICEKLTKNGGGVISVVGGFSQGNHTRPLYNYIDLLISVILDSGYEIVDLNSL